MTINNKPLVLDLVEWIAAGARPYAEVMEAWRTSCPRLPVWEDAVDLGFVVRVYRDGAGAMVEATDAGRAFLVAEGRTNGNKDFADIAEGVGEEDVRDAVRRRDPVPDGRDPSLRSG